MLSSWSAGLQIGLLVSASAHSQGTHNCSSSGPRPGRPDQVTFSIQTSAKLKMKAKGTSSAISLGKDGHPDYECNIIHCPLSLTPGLLCCDRL